MTVVGYSTLEVIPSMKGLRAQLEKQTTGDFAAAGRAGGKKYGDAAGREASEGFKSRMSSSLKGFNPLAGLAVGAAGFTLFKSAISEASEAEQAIGGVNAVFGKYAATVEDASTRAADALGLSSTAYQQLVTVSGALLKNKGIEDFAAQSQRLVEIGADLSAMFGGSTLEAVQALNAALRGESDPIERYAISLNEAAINAKLAAAGSDKLTGAALDQAKTQARLALILEQSADAQGSFARESDTFAGQSQRLTADLAEMRRELGEELLPAASAFVSVARNDLVPALGEAGGLAKDAVVGFSQLPAPVQAAAAAFVALKLASATGLSDNLGRATELASRSMDDLRLRTLLARDEYNAYRTNASGAVRANGSVIVSNGRVAASMAAVRVGTAGASVALRGFGASAAAALGGPWGIALIAGTVALTAFMSRQKEAKFEIDGLTESLDKQTGAITGNTRALVAQALEDRKTLGSAKLLGIALADVTDAALGNEDAFNRVKEARERILQQASQDPNFDLNFNLGQLGAVVTAIGDVRTETAGAQEQARRLAEANADGAAASGAGAAALRDYGTEIRDARTELQKLIDKEQERATNAIQNQRDALGLVVTLQATRKEAAEGARTLDIQTEAGQKNKAALLELADQWSNSTEKVQNARGAYEQMRRDFISVAVQMGATKTEAQKLADELLEVPKVAPIKFQSEGFKKTMEEIKAAAKALDREYLFVTGVGRRHNAGSTPEGFARGGKVGGPGIGDSRLILADPREWVINPKASAYYGDGIMSMINKMQLPKFANGGPVAAAPAMQSVTTSAAPMFDFRGSVIQPPDYRGFMRDMQDRAARADGSNVRFDSVGGN